MLSVYKTNPLTHCLLLNIIITELIRYDSDMQIRSRCTCHCHVKHCNTIECVTVMHQHVMCHVTCPQFPASRDFGFIRLYYACFTRISYKSYGSGQGVAQSACESNFSDFGYIVGEKQIYRMNFSTQRKLVYLYCNLRLLDQFQLFMIFLKN